MSEKKFDHSVLTEEQSQLLKDLVNLGREDEAWEMYQKILGKSKKSQD